MPIAQRFRRGKKPDHSTSLSLGVVNPSLADLSEADYKRAQLMFDLNRIISEAIRLGSSVKALVMDIEVTKKD